MVKRTNTLGILRAERYPLVYLASIAMLARVFLLALSLSAASADPTAASLMQLCAPSGGSQIAKIEGSTHTQNPLGIGCDCTYMCPHTSKQATYLSFEPENWQNPTLVVAGSLSLESVRGNIQSLRGRNFLIRAPPVV
ncbi:hypothetical protein [Pseudovibrio sp. Tun.PSC04-5.I4]|uniref:hypothetical protein n=1 Tax=Pseudovibrio sp. Tun.PSC04-5.I4 TaxID=1798213 RepID=UPI0008800C8D|nr:hypothetical protein [Pseudovibrio sp. Tun.PSC04-5.I4]SDQ82205.1 hypothetical protein SAMN04515695_1531 [Pseudovibrio sp. Tun.PSC04-5.I4]